MKLLKGLVGTSLVAATAMIAVGWMSEASAQEPVTLTFVRPGSPEKVKQVYQPVLDAFMAANPNIKVEATYMGFDEMFQRMPLAAATGKLPDVLLASSILFTPLAANNALMPLDDVIPAELKADIAKPYWDSATWDGKIMGVPAVISPMALWYNADLFKAAGLDPDKPPTTWDELVKDAQAITDKTDAAGIGIYGFKRNDVTDELAALVQSNSDVWFWDTEKQQLRSPNTDVVTALQFMVDLTQKYKVTQANVDAFSSDDVRGMLRDGTVGMILSSPPTLAVVGNDPKFRVATVPAGPSGKWSGASNLDPWVISAKTAHPKEALQLLWFLSNAESVSAAAKGYGSLPALASVQKNDPTYKEGIWPAFVQTVAGTFYSTKPITPQMSLSQDQIPDMAQRALTGKQKPEESLDALYSLFGWTE
jgi:multiple sugar transport system substrate-binding protein